MAERTADRMLAATAARHPDRVAVRSATGALTYAELDEAVTRCARALRTLVGPSRQIIALASLLDMSFAVAYYGIMRSGNMVAPINPLLREPELRHVVDTSQARLAIVNQDVADRLSAMRAELPSLTELRLIGDGEPLLASVTPADGPLPATRPDDVAAVHFTSGTTGPSKAVMLTHDNITVNAGQVARAHHLDHDSVSLNFLPTYHPMHLNSAVMVGAAQVLWTDPDVAKSIGAANEYHATHYYSLPMRLTRLAADSRLASLSLRTVRMIASGGSALAPAVARTLSDHFGVPVFQGYGLAETSPLTHSDGPVGTRPGSVGPPVDGTECRIVQVDSRAVVGPGEPGEVQVRGPQLMKGYLSAPDSSFTDADGWLSTGDVGHQDADGYLFLVDRIKDVFKCDNWLVSPSQIEQVLAGHPAVADCVVVDCPDEFSGAVATAMIVRSGADGADEIAAWANERMPYYQHLRHIEVVERIPRSANGKLQRRELRTRLTQLRGEGT
ncbi:AMP-binding protein [Kutzneria sp. NPDC051319]|uniref:class I adenylate-forming enzyme family protein n=1 Tax=Kutzneria sp. NPDC051319 TaxID=3155047 RepID=UPI003414ADBF